MKQLQLDFFVIGVARGGTTSLYNYLQQHPGIFLPKVKECNFFSEVASLDKEAYDTPEEDKEYHMKIIQDEKVYFGLFEKAEDSQLKGEISPSYLWDKNTAERIYNHNPNAKLLISLRNPIERAHSHYLMNYQTGHDKESSFEAALHAPKRRIWGGGNMYLEMGMYYQQLKPYYHRFNTENIKVIVSEVWTRNNGEALNDIYKFLGLHSFDHYEVDTAHNAAKQLKNKGLLEFLRLEKIKRPLKWLLPEKAKDKLKDRWFYKEGEKQFVNPETYHKLEGYFREDIDKTAILTGLDLGEIWQITDHSNLKTTE
jgi:hypothetical protein